MEIPDLENTKTKVGLRRLFYPSLIFFSAFIGIGFLSLNILAITKNKTSAAEIQSGDKDFTDFAEIAAINLNNISYTNMNQQRSDLTGILSDELITLYNKYFYDPDFLRLIADRKLYVTFQKIERSSIANRAGNVVSVKVIGFDTYHSDLTQTQAEYPFTLLIQIEKGANGKMLVTKIKRS